MTPSPDNHENDLTAQSGDLPTEETVAPSPSEGLHVAPGESHAIKQSLWRRWMSWSGSFLVLSILLHALLIGGGALLVVKVVQGQKDKLRFTAPPPSANAASKSVEHKVKAAKKNASMSSPSINKRITSTAANVSIALPAMEMNNAGPDVMASVMSSVGTSGLGAGSAAMSMPMSGMTAFGFKGVTPNAGLIGHVYDLKQTPARQPTDIKDDGELRNPHLLDNLTGQALQDETGKIWFDKSKLGKRADLLTQSVQSHAAVLDEFFSRNWDDSVLKRYYQSKDPVTSFQFFIPATGSDIALKAFGADKEVKPTHFLIHYKGFVKAPRDGDFRFRVVGSAWVRFAEDTVVAPSWNAFYPLFKRNYFEFKSTTPPPKTPLPQYDYSPGKWFHVEAGKRYPMEVLMDAGTGSFNACLMIEQRGPDKPYPTRFMSELFPQDTPCFYYPVFAMMKGIPFDPYDKKFVQKQQCPPGYWDPQGWRPWEAVPQTMPEPLIFPGVK